MGQVQLCKQCKLPLQILNLLAGAANTTNCLASPIIQISIYIEVKGVKNDAIEIHTSGIVCTNMEVLNNKDSIGVIKISFCSGFMA